MSKKKQSAGTAATALLHTLKVPHTLHPYTHQDGVTAFGTEAATALGVAPERIFKTLVVDTNNGKSGLTIAVVPVASQLSLKAIGSWCHEKRVSMADPQVAARVTGYVVGGISPIATKTALPTVIDESAVVFDTIFVSAGKRGLQVEIDPQLLASVTGAAFAAIAA